MRAAGLRLLRREWAVALLVVPLALAAIEAVGQRAQLRVLLYPPLAPLAYLLFTRPHGRHATLLGAVVAPSLGAAVGTVGSHLFHPGFLGVLTVTFTAMLLMRLLRVDTAPTLAAAMLPLLFGGRGLDYPLSILLLSTVIFLLFKGWRWAVDNLPADR